MCVLSEHDLSSILFDSLFAIKILGNRNIVTLMWIFSGVEISVLDISLIVREGGKELPG